MRDRISVFAERLGVSLETARAMVEPLTGLNQKEFDDHLGYLVERPYMQGSITPSSHAVPPPDTEKTRAEVVAFMSDLLDEKTDAVAQPLSEEGDLGGVADDIVRYFADLDNE